MKSAKTLCLIDKLLHMGIIVTFYVTKTSRRVSDLI